MVLIMGRNHQTRSSPELEVLRKKSRDSERMPAVAQPIGFDTRTFVDAQDLSTFPYSAICALMITPSPGAEPIGGTGFFIHPRVVITAGHCVYNLNYFNANPSNNGWPVSVEVIPAMNAAAANPRPHGYEIVTYIESDNPFRVHAGLLGHFDAMPCDYGAILLSSDLGANLGAFPCEPAATLPLVEVPATLAGYPYSVESEVTALDGGRMCRQSLSSVTLGLSPVVSYEFDTSPGQSGSPVWTNVGNHQHVAVAIHCKFGSRLDNCGRRITSEVVDDFRTWIDEAS
ncbi:trypsin-like peptidase domain-containing protein [Sorangium sp. So ce448]|uniref:trypsin-like serine peptidase n=1 Tax=Sorangium sp. So ce448 TaxID=3133314 RepID=UPI003F634CDD